MGARKARTVRLRWIAAGGLAAAACVCAVFSVPRDAPGQKTAHNLALDATPARIWTVENIAAFKASVAQAPVSAQGRLFAIEKTGNGVSGIVAVDLRSGAVLWRAATRTSGYLCADSIAVYGAAPGEPKDGGDELSAFDCKSGRLLWRHVSKSGGRWWSPSVAAVGEALCWTRGDMVECVSKRSGRSLWRRTIDAGAIAGKAAGEAGRIVIAAGNCVYCLTPGNEVVWKSAFSRAMSSLDQPRVLCRDGLVFVAHREITGSGTLLCLDGKDGNTLWCDDNEECGHLLADGGRLFVRSSAVRAFDEKTGAALWSFPATGCAPLACNGTTIYVSESGDRGALVSLDALNGLVRNRCPSLGSCTGVVVEDGLMVVHSIRGALFAVRSKEPPFGKSST